MPYHAADTTKTSRQFFSFLISNPSMAAESTAAPPSMSPHPTPRKSTLNSNDWPAFPTSRFPHYSAFALPPLHPIPTHPSRSSNPTGAYIRPQPRRFLSQVSRRDGCATRCVRHLSHLAFTLTPLLAYIKSFTVGFQHVQTGPQNEPARVLFDPVFSESAGPSPWVVIRRRLPPPCIAAELPDFQFLVYSYNQCVFSENRPSVAQ